MIKIVGTLFYFAVLTGIIGNNLIVIINADDSAIGPPSVRLTEKEGKLLEQFKKLVIPRIPRSSVIHNISQDDLYLVGWLRVNNFNVKITEQQFLQSLEWRREFNIDNITNEEWSSFREDYPAYVDTFDKFDRPTAELWISDWDVRRAVLAGHGLKLSRWINYHFEQNLRRLYRLRREGKNVTQAVLLTDVEAFGFRQGCPICSAVFVRLGANWESYYPGLLERAVAINMTPAFQMILDAMRPLLREDTRQTIKTYVRRSHWLQALDNQFGKAERSPRFGGTKER